MIPSAFSNIFKPIVCNLIKLSAN